MANFPFVVQPRLKPIIERIGSEDAGYIEIRRQGYLSVGEKAGARQIMSAYDATADVIALAKRVAADKKVDMQEAYEAVSGALTGQGTSDLVNEVSSGYEEDLTATLKQLSQAAFYSDLAKAFVLLMYRVEGAGAITMDDAAEMHPDHLEGLAALYDEEEAKTTEKLLEQQGEATVEEVEDASGK